MRTAYIFFTISIFLAALMIPSISEAQFTSSGLGLYMPISDEDINDGDIICLSDNSLRKCNRAYDPSMTGVISLNPVIAVEDSEIEDGYAVISSGIANVRITASNGEIEEGDYITTSETPGVAQLATNDGYILGIALDPFSGEEVGTIQIAINIHPAVGITSARSNLINQLRQGFATPLLEPISYLRYLFAAAMVIISVGLGMTYFGKATRTGLEAIGRNPMAKRLIQANLILSVGLTLVIILVGLGIAYLILIL